jgi:outer membrane biosynthesis protein TonB
MRKSYLLLAGAGAVLLAACSGDKKVAINDDLKNDLALASSSDGITLANSSPNAGQQVVSAIEQTAPPTRKPAASTRVKHHKPAPKATPQVAKAKAPATVDQTETQSVAMAPVADDPTPVSPRPQPVAVSYPSGASSGGGNGSSGRGSSSGSVLGSILGAVIRGGIVIGDGDACDPRTDGQHTAVNRRYPRGVYGGMGRAPTGRMGVPTSTFPSGSGVGGLPR